MVHNLSTVSTMPTCQFFFVNKNVVLHQNIIFNKWYNYRVKKKKTFEMQETRFRQAAWLNGHVPGSNPTLITA